MTRTLTAVMLLTALALPAGARAAQPDAGTLSRWCSQHVRSLDGQVLEPNEAIEAASCLAYARGVLDAQAIYTRNGGRRPWCLPQGAVVLDDVARAAAKTPQNPAEAMIARLEAVLTGAYPCN